MTWATSVPILVFLGLSVCSRLRPDVRDRQTSDVRQHYRLMPPPRGRGIIKYGDAVGINRHSDTVEPGDLHL